MRFLSHAAKHHSWETDMSYERERERTSRDLEDAGNCVQCHLEYSEDGNGKANIDMLGGPGSGKEGEGRET